MSWSVYGENENQLNRPLTPMTHDGPEHGSVEKAAERLISLAEAADVCGLSSAHLRRLVRNRLIWGKKIGRNWVTTEEAVRKYLAQDRRPGPKPKRD